MKNKKQKEIDALKDKIAGKEIVKWEDVKRKEGSNSLYDLSFIDQGKGTALIKLEDKNANIVPAEIKEALEEALKPEQDINHYRELKTLLVEQTDLLMSKAGLTNEEIEAYREKVDDLIVETNTARYEDAAQRLADDKGFEELEQLQKEYQESLETLALETVVESKKQLKSATINLLEILRGEDNE